MPVSTRPGSAKGPLLTAKLVLATVLAALVAGSACSGSGSDAERRAAVLAADHVGSARCMQCHVDEHARWSGSHHDRAMQVADESTVLGDFADVERTRHGVTSRFFRGEGGEYVVRTDGPDGELADFEIAYTFGVEPLQQYLVRFPGGRMQVLPWCWDTRPASEGGQRWFHLYGDEAVPAGDELHWTGRNQNWNFMCASCHSTHLQKGYDLEGDRYDTTWAEIDVSCEACHGPGSVHVERAEAGRLGEGAGFALDLSADAAWVFDEGAVTARREPPPPARIEDDPVAAAQVASCAPCHARRTMLDDAMPAPAHPEVLDGFRVALLDEGLYFADGQIDDEVYVHGSFVQSRMYHAGVACSDCHEPHSQRLLAQGNALCARCHQPSTFDTTAHHMHAPGSEGASCVACHMPERTYMVVDDRRDHSIRVPRPDLTASLGVPNACNGCHTDRSARWAAEAVRAHAEAHPGADKKRERPQFAPVLHAARRGLPGARAELARLAETPSWPAIARATAVDALGRDLAPSALPTVVNALADRSPIVRTAAVGALQGLPAEVVVPRLVPLLEDPVRTVRAEAARVLVPVRDRLPAVSAAAWQDALDEYEAIQRANADRASGRANLASLRMQQGRAGDAERLLLDAVRMEPRWAPAYVQLADLYREQGRERDAEKILRTGLKRASPTADVRASLGLLFARTGRVPQAVTAFARIAREHPGQPRFAYLHAVALHSSGAVDEAVRVLTEAQARHPHDRDLLFALTTFHRDAGDLDAARSWARKLAARDPEDREAQALLRSLGPR